MTNRKPELRLVPAPRIDPNRVQPHAPDLERALVASILLDERVIDLVLDLVAREDFYDQALGTIYEAASELRRNCSPVGLVSVTAWLRDRSLLEKVGGAVAIASIAQLAPVIGHAVDHARAIALKSKLRRLIAECQIIDAEAHGDVGDVARYLEHAGRRLHMITDSHVGRSSVGMRESMQSAFRELGIIAQRRGQLSGYPTKLVEVDLQTGGMHGTDVTMLGGETGRGKSALAGCIAVNIASSPQIEQMQIGHQAVDVTVPIGVGWFSLEMPHKQLATRLACALGRVDFNKISTGNWNHDDWDRLAGAASVLSELPIEIDDDSDLTINRLAAKVARMEADFARRGIRLGLVILDYIQLMDGREEAEKGATRERQLNEIGRQVKKLAGRFLARPHALVQVGDRVEDYGVLEPSGVSWMVLTQLNEEGEIRESKALGMHANNIWILEQPKDTAGGPRWTGPSKTQLAHIHIKKQRSGPRNVRASVWWHEAYTLFSDEERPS